MNLPAGSAADAWRRHPFFARIARVTDLAAADIESLRRLIESDVAIKKKKDLVVDGYEYRKLCFVEDGFAVRYKLLRNGKRQIVNVVLPGDVVGLPGSFLERAAYSVIAVTDMRLQVCALDDYVELCRRQPQFGMIVAWLAVYEAALCAEHVVDTGRRTPTERLAHFLLEMHMRLSAVGRADAASLDLPFSQEVIGDALGLSVPHINRTLAQLRKEGLIAVDGRRITFADLDALQRLGQFQPLALARIPLSGRSLAN